MIIDLILDRKDGDPYSPRQFYFDCLRYGEIGHGITRAMDGGTEQDVKAELCAYIHENEYNPAICEYVKSVDWLEGAPNGQEED